MAKHAEHSHAWGLEVGGSAVRLVRLKRDAGADGGFVVDAMHRADYAEDAARGLADALASLPLPAADEPLAVCIADEAVLYRRLELPTADPEALEQMVRSQMEVLLPLPPDQLVWGWGRTGEDGSGDVLLCAARREAAEPLADAGMSQRPTLTLPSALAAGAVLRRFYLDADERVVLLDVAAHTTATLITGPGGPEHVATTAGGGDLLSGAEVDTETEAEDGDALAAWQREVSAAYRQALQASPDAPAPGRCILIGRGSRAAGVERAAGQALGVLVTRVDWPRGLTLARHADAAADEMLPAIGAALHVLSPPTPLIALGDGRAEHVRARPAVLSKRALFAVAVIVLAAGALYWLDVRHAARLEAATESGPADEEHREEMAQALALGEFLQSQPPPPLLVLQAVSASVSEATQIKEWQYDRQGRFSIGGTARGMDELDETLTGVTKAAPFDDVEMRSANVERNTWTFSIETALVPLHQYIALLARTPPPASGGDAEEAAHDDE